MLAIYVVLYLLGVLGEFLYILCASILYLYACPIVILGRILHPLSRHIARCVNDGFAHCTEDGWLLLWLIICVAHLHVLVALGVSQ